MVDQHLLAVHTSSARGTATVSDGRGSMIWPSGSYYVGAFAADKRHGSGKHVLKSGESYSGEWQHGKKHGAGTMAYANGNAYTGQWVSCAPLDLTYIRMSWRLVHDLRCHVKHSRLHPSNVPTNASVVVHKLKRPSGHEYLWRLYGNGSWRAARSHVCRACWELAFGAKRLTQAVAEHQV